MEKFDMRNHVVMQDEPIMQTNNDLKSSYDEAVIQHEIELANIDDDENPFGSDEPEAVGCFEADTNNGFASVAQENTLGADLVLIADEALDELLWIIGDMAKFPSAVFLEHGMSGLFMLIVSKEGAPALKQDMASEIKLSFENLCQSVPHLSKQCVMLISMAYSPFRLSNMSNF